VSRSSLRGRAALLSVAVGALVALAGCEVDPYCVECGDGGDEADGGDGGDLGSRDLGDVDLTFVDLGPVDGGVAVPDACTPGAVELCNGFDDNCDGVIDEGFDLQTSMEHCGACNSPCAPANAFGECIAGECAISSCGVGYVDLDVNPATGCEYRCTESAIDDTTCNSRDDDCDGLIDEDVALLTDVLNCGSCGRSCRASHATSTCVAGDCTLGVCDPGYIDLDGAPLTGCEYACTASGAETCNRRDDNCDGAVDEGNPGGGAACGSSIGACHAGVMTCTAGTLRCVGEALPTVETCNGLDDDCDGSTDEGFLDAINNCGTCGNICSFPNAVATCTARTCTLAICNSGFVDRDGSAANGCEYACEFAGTEVCNGRDDDCDGSIDEGLTVPTSLCNSTGVCLGTVPVCGATGWTCTYPSTYQAVETLCDDLDNDCDGATDETFPMKGLACGNGVGACRNTGVYACNAAGTAAPCNAAPAGARVDEICDGIDNDCDGSVDETRTAPGTDASYVHDDVAQVSASLWMYQYEATRPDASATLQGGATGRACSRAGKIPWTNVNYPEALAACTAAGMRLCTEAEFQTSCQGSGTCTWSSSTACTTYSSTACNGNDFDTNAATVADDDAVLATGSMPMCYQTWTARNVYDLSGNVKEWTTRRSAGVNPIRGGASNNTAAGIACTFNFTVANDTFRFPNVGFRCCSSTAP
jgi:hypothetical protein